MNDRLGRAEDLARDPQLLAGLHEWAAIVHGGGGLCTLASIHYNLFLGSLLDHEGRSARDLTEFTTLQRTGTFLCTELAHGNDACALQTTAEFDRNTGGFVLHTPHPGPRSSCRTPASPAARRAPWWPPASWWTARTRESSSS